MAVVSRTEQNALKTAAEINAKYPGLAKAYAVDVAQGAAVKKLGDPPTDEDLHSVRIGAKRCRYAAEAVAPTIGKRARTFARAAADLQQVLGDHHDAVVAEGWLRDWAAGARSRQRSSRPR